MVDRINPESDCDATVAASAFKRAHSRYRRRPEAPDRLDDLHELIDFSCPSNSAKTPVTFSLGSPRTTGTAEPFNRVNAVANNNNNNNNKDCYMGPMFGIEGFQGFIFAPRALSKALQESLAHAAVTTYCESPHLTNIEMTLPKPFEVLNTVERNETMWSLWKQEHGLSALNPSERIQNDRKSFYRTFRKLSWATMGYHYDWTRRCYHENAKSPMPVELERLGQLFAYTAFLLSLADQESTFSYTASASIVNYYTNKSCMGGHRDDLEFALDKPILSLSLGRPAIFLLGGNTKDDSPVVPIVVRPGDVMIMSGETRLNYHSMARLLPEHGLPEVEVDCCPTTKQQALLERIVFASKSTVESSEQKAIAAFLSNYRININMRQVYPD